MQYANLHDLIMRSSSTRRYFLSLPVSLQLQLHEQNACIHSAAQLRAQVYTTEKYNRSVELADSLFLSARK